MEVSLFKNAKFKKVYCFNFSIFAQYLQKMFHIKALFPEI